MSDWHSKKRIRKRGGQGMKARALLRKLDRVAGEHGTTAAYGHKGLKPVLNCSNESYTCHQKESNGQGE